MILILFSLALLPRFSSAQMNYLPDILEYDVLEIRIQPIVEDLIARASSPNSNNMWISYTSNASGYSVVEMYPGSRGTYNLTISFRTTGPWNYSIGVLTSNPAFYSNGFSKTADIRGYFVRFYAISVPSSGEAVNTLTFIVHAQGRSPSLFSFAFPKSINGVFFVAVTFLIGYINVFFLVDLHFKSKIEGIPKRRGILVGLLMLASAYIVYRMYVFTTFTPLWEG